jgi:hypothetical protein
VNRPTLAAQQAAATASFQEIVRNARAAIARLDFPLGSPARGYDLQDIEAELTAWLSPRSAALLDAEAAVHRAGATR